MKMISSAVVFRRTGNATQPSRRAATSNNAMTKHTAVQDDAGDSQPVRQIHWPAAL